MAKKNKKRSLAQSASKKKHSLAQSATIVKQKQRQKQTVIVKVGEKRITNINSGTGQPPQKKEQLKTSDLLLASLMRPQQAPPVILPQQSAPILLPQQQPIIFSGDGKRLGSDLNIKRIEDLENQLYNIDKKIETQRVNPFNYRIRDEDIFLDTTNREDNEDEDEMINDTRISVPLYRPEIVPEIVPDMQEIVKNEEKRGEEDFYNFVKNFGKQEFETDREIIQRNEILANLEKERGISRGISLGSSSREHSLAQSATQTTPSLPPLRQSTEIVNHYTTETLNNMSESELKDIARSFRLHIGRSYKNTLINRILELQKQKR